MKCTEGYKAKGLEFENVIILEAIDGGYPFFDKKPTEEIRKFVRCSMSPWPWQRNAYTSHMQNACLEYPNVVTLTISTRKPPDLSAT